jgi:hypothetical protein
MRYIGTFINEKGQEVRRAFDAHDEEELRRLLEKNGLKIRDLKIDGTLEAADAHSILNISAKIISGIAVLLTAALLFSIPFPFVRKVWFGEIWGYYGLMNIICFAAIAWGLNKMSVIAVIVGLAALLYEQLLTWLGFYQLYTAGAVTQPVLYFISFSVVLTLILLTVYLKAFSAIHLYYDVKRELGKKRFTAMDTDTAKYAWRFGVFMLYFLIPAGVYFMPSGFQSAEILAAMRILGFATCLISASGIGYEVQRFFRVQEWTLHSIGIILFHSIVLAVMGSWIYSKTPLEIAYQAASV